MEITAFGIDLIGLVANAGRAALLLKDPVLRFILLQFFPVLAPLLLIYGVGKLAQRLRPEMRLFAYALAFLPGVWLGYKLMGSPFETQTVKIGTWPFNSTKEVEHLSVGVLVTILAIGIAATFAASLFGADDSDSAPK